MKAIILSGGKGTRLYPLTKIVSKQLQAVYDKPMIYYPLTALMAAGVNDFCIISDPENIENLETLLGTGRKWGISIEYRKQVTADGIAQAFLIGESFIGRDPVILMLGDNIFSGGSDLPDAIKEFAAVTTSSPCPISKAFSGKKSAADPSPTPMACFTPQ